MERSNKLWRRLVLGMALVVTYGFGSPLALASSGEQEILYIGDVADNTVKQIDARSGAFLGNLVVSGSGGLNGPMGMLFRGGKLLVANQNFGADNGEILRFDHRRGSFLGQLVAANDPNAPFAPRGMVRGQGDVLYVADLGTRGDSCANQGRIARFHAGNGKFLGDLDRTGFAAEFHPRGVVFGPDGLLYVSAVGCLTPTDPLFNPLTGYVLRFDPRTGRFVDVFASNTSVPNLHRPEGLVFDPDGHLWVTSFRANPADSDRILKLDGRTGLQIDALVLALPASTGGKRAFAQAILFGPGDDLFIPISGGDATTAGQLRRCKVAPLHCETIVPAGTAGGPLQAPFYLIFEQSDPATLGFEDD